MNKKLLIFDIDGTLCDINKPVNNKLKDTLQALEEKNQLVLASGKPFSYIAGFVRQLGLKNCIVIGENGGTIMYSATFPPNNYDKVNPSLEVKELFYKIETEYSLKFGNSIWFQPNDVNLTIFPIKLENIGKIHSFAKQFESNKINTYYHKDSIDFTPKGFDKGTAVDNLIDKLKTSTDELYVFGDGDNDIPMLLKTKNSYLVNSNINSFKAKGYIKNYNMLNIFLKKFI